MISPQARPFSPPAAKETGATTRINTQSRDGSLAGLMNRCTSGYLFGERRIRIIGLSRTALIHGSGDKLGMISMRAGDRFIRYPLHTT
jgi:hypothetical protein